MVKKSICIITTIDKTITSFIIPVARELQGRGYSITFISSMQDSFIEKNKQEFNLINLPMERGAKPIGMIKSIIAFYKIFKREKFDLIQYATPNASFYASIASMLTGCKKRVYCQWGIRYVGFTGVNRMIFKLLEELTCKFSTHIRPASQKNLEFAVSEKLYHASKAKVMGDGGTIGIDFSQFDINRKSALKEQIYKKHPALKNKVVFGFIGRLDKDKGVNELFKAFIELNKRNDNVALVVVGGIDKPSGINDEYYTIVKNMNNVLFTGFTTEVVAYLSSFDYLVHPSYREGFSMVIQQAMAMGVCVITTNIPGPSEVIENGVSGITVTVKSAEELENAMRTMIENKPLTDAFAEAGYKRAKALFSRNRMVEVTIIDREDILNTELT